MCVCAFQHSSTSVWSLETAPAVKTSGTLEGHQKDVLGALLGAKYRLLLSADCMSPVLRFGVQLCLCTHTCVHVYMYMVWGGRTGHW